MKCAGDELMSCLALNELEALNWVLGKDREGKTQPWPSKSFLR